MNESFDKQPYIDNTSSTDSVNGPGQIEEDVVAMPVRT